MALPLPWRSLFRHAFAPLHQTEQVLLRMTNVYTIINQVVFFTLCDRAVGSGGRSVNSVYSLMLYNVVAYCIRYVASAWTRDDWTPYVTVSEHSNVRHLAMTTTRLVLEWTKVVTVVATVAFLVLSFAANEGLSCTWPSIWYTLLTLLHYAATEKSSSEAFPACLKRLRLTAFDSLEALWAPVLLRVYAILGSVCLVVVQVCLRNYRLAAFGLYVNVVLCWKDAARGCFRRLRRELAVLRGFPDASRSQLTAFDDICSVCLSAMAAAKVTPCRHLFHADCLRRCLKTRQECPICKTSLADRLPGASG